MEKILKDIKKINDLVASGKVDKKLIEACDPILKLMEKQKNMLILEEYSKFFEDNQNFIDDEITEDLNKWGQVNINEIDLEMLLDKAEKIKININNKKLQNSSENL